MNRGVPHPAVAGYIVASVLWVGAILVGLIPAQGDALNYYNHLDPPYAQHDYASGAGFYYAPPMLLLAKLVALAGPQVFYAVCVALGLAAVGWIGGKWAVALLFFPPVWWDISAGNVNTVIGACAVAMLARPGWIAVPLLTKVTPGIVGLWWVVRGEWTAVRTAGLVTGGVCVLSFVVAPSWWLLWAQALVSNGTGYIPPIFAVPVPLLPRLGLAALLVVWGARRNRRWVLPAAACLSLPVLWWSGLAALAALLRDRRAEREHERVRGGRRWRRGGVRDLDGERARDRAVLGLHADGGEAG